MYIVCVLGFLPSCPKIRPELPIPNTSKALFEESFPFFVVLISLELGQVLFRFVRSVQLDGQSFLSRLRSRRAVGRGNMEASL